MLSPKKYRQLIAEIGIEDMELDVSTLSASMKTLNQLEESKNVLKKMRYNIRMDIRKIRLDHMNEIKELQVSSQEKGLLGRQKSSKQIINKKKELKKKQEIRIASYELIEDTIDNYLTQIDDARVYIRKSIENLVK